MVVFTLFTPFIFKKIFIIGFFYMYEHTYMHICNMLIMKHNYQINTQEPTVQLWNWSISSITSTCVPPDL